jgi:HEAT repeat protein
MESKKIKALFAQTLVGDYEGDEAWAAVSALRHDGSREIFEHAAQWCHAADPLRRARAAAILCQLRRSHPPDLRDSPEVMFRDESYELIAKMLENEQNPAVLDSAIHALGHLADPKAIPIVLRYQDDPDPDVRLAVAFALGCFPNEPQSITGLMKLAMDSNIDVRDWAVFGLGVLGDLDSPEIREALLRCLNDSVDDVREEAAVGLGKRHDQRVIPKLQTMLRAPELNVRVAEAAAALLELGEIPAQWTAADIEAALRLKFNLEDY